MIDAVLCVQSINLHWLSHREPLFQCYPVFKARDYRYRKKALVMSILFQIFGLNYMHVFLETVVIKSIKTLQTNSVSFDFICIALLRTDIVAKQL